MTTRPANPLTDQLLAAIHQVIHQSPYTPTEQTLAAKLADLLTTGLPDIDPGTVGEVLLHIGPTIAGLIKKLNAEGRPPGRATAAAMRVVNLAAAELYTENRAPFNDDTANEAPTDGAK